MSDFRLSPNRTVYGYGLSFLDFAIAAKGTRVEIGDMAPPFVCNAVFAIELFFKSLAATTQTVEELRVGDTPLAVEHSSSPVKGHSLLKVFSQLPLEVQQVVETRCEAREPATPFRQALEHYGNAFVASRYAYEEQHRDARFNLGLGGVADIAELACNVRDAIKIDLPG